MGNGESSCLASLSRACDRNDIRQHDGRDPFNVYFRNIDCLARDFVTKEAKEPDAEGPFANDLLHRETDSGLAKDSLIDAAECLDLEQGTSKERNIAIAVVRHGERLDMLDRKSWFQSELGKEFPFDCPLTATGEAQASEVAEQLPKLVRPGVKFCAVVSSPYIRCIGTASMICRVLKLPLCIDAELGEIYGPQCFGKWEEPPPCRTPLEVEKWIPADVKLVGPSLEVNARAKAFTGEKPVWPESVVSARLRLVRRVEHYAERAASLGTSFILVTHGDCVAACSSLTLASTLSQVGPCKIEYCGHVILERLVSENETKTFGISDIMAGWQVQHKRIGLAAWKSSGGDRGFRGPMDPRPLHEEAADLHALRHRHKVVRTVSEGIFASLLAPEADEEEKDSKVDPDEGDDALVRFHDLLPNYPRGRSLTKTDTDLSQFAV